jgi:hypothetical protein
VKDRARSLRAGDAHVDALMLVIFADPSLRDEHAPDAALWTIADRRIAARTCLTREAHGAACVSRRGWSWHESCTVIGWF